MVKIPLTLKDFPKPDLEPQVAQPDWICAPIGLSDTSGSLEYANFDEMEDQFLVIDPHSDTWECVFFPHFAAGLVTNIFVKPGSAVEEQCNLIRDRMANYPCLNEDKWVEYECAGQDRTKTK